MLPRATFLCFPNEKVLKEKHFANVEEVKQINKKKWQKHEKTSKLMSSKTVLSSGKNVLIGVLHQMESTLTVTEVET